MIKISKIIALLLVFNLSTLLLAQSIIYTEGENYIPETTNQSEPDENINTAKPSKINYNINLGSSFSTSNFGNAVNIYTAPQLRYKFAPKLSLRTGFLISNTTISGYYRNEKSNRNNYTSSYIFTGIDYQATEKLRVSGEIIYGLNDFQNQLNSVKKPEYSLRLNAEYKVTKSFSIGVQVSKQQSNNPFAYGMGGNSFTNNLYTPYNSFIGY